MSPPMILSWVDFGLPAFFLTCFRPGDDGFAEFFRFMG